MKLFHNREGRVRIKIEETDDYGVIEDDGVDFFPTEKQIAHMMHVFSRRDKP